MTFEDHFSRLARRYSQHRPAYPAELFGYLSEIAPGHDLAWDCGTGNGQAARALAHHFDRVYASDASADQIAEAAPHEKIEYRVEPAEAVSLEDGAVDVVTVAVAVHWFDFERFYPQVERVLKPDGVLAVWTYHLPVIAPEVDRLLRGFYGDVLGSYWPERFRYVDDQYRSLPFPFPELNPPPFTIAAEWDLDRLAGFLGSWSATQRYAEKEGRHPLKEVWPELRAAWGGAERKRSVRWPLHTRVGRRVGDGAEITSPGARPPR